MRERRDDGREVGRARARVQRKRHWTSPCVSPPFEERRGGGLVPLPPQARVVGTRRSTAGFRLVRVFLAHPISYFLSHFLARVT